MASTSPAPDGIPAAIGASLAVDLDTVFADLSATLDELRDRRSTAIHAAANRALGVPTTAEDLDGWLAAQRDRDGLRRHYLVALHLAHLGGVELDGLVTNARRYGATWQEIASVLWVNRQTAHYRFRHLDAAAASVATVGGGPELDPLVPLDGGDDLTAAERAVGGRLDDAAASAAELDVTGACLAARHDLCRASTDADAAGSCACPCHAS